MERDLSDRRIPVQRGPFGEHPNSDPCSLFNMDGDRGECRIYKSGFWRIVKGQDRNILRNGKACFLDSVDGPDGRLFC